MQLNIRLFVTLLLIQSIVADDDGIHLPIYRRGGRFARREFANITRLSETLSNLEARYARTYTAVDGNRIVRRWRDGPDGPDDYMLHGAGLDGTWYTKLTVGEPPQILDVDIDMLSPDFYTIMTTNEKGSKYDTFKSTTHIPSNDHPHSHCISTSDTFHLHPSGPPTRLLLPLCTPPKYTHHTLHNSGTILGLAPSTPGLSHLGLSSPSLLTQLLNTHQIPHPILSLTLLTSSSGLLSLGSTIAPTLERLKLQTSISLSHLSDPDPNPEAISAELESQFSFAIPEGSTHATQFQWTDVGRGAVAGWHSSLAAGIWINGVKVLRNQPVVFDVNCPFILAPRAVVETLYAAVPGGRSVEALLDVPQEEQEQEQEHEAGRAKFHTFPCLNPPLLSLSFPNLLPLPLTHPVQTSDDQLYGPQGGRFSLGKLNTGNATDDADEVGVKTGYCVGVIVGADAGDVWVLGEPFFRGVGVVFNMAGEEGRGRVGVRRY